MTAAPAAHPARLPFTETDFQSAGPGYQRLRSHCARVRIASDYEAIHEAGEICWPYRQDVRWMVWRDTAGVWLDEPDTQKLLGPVATLGEALSAAADIVDAERQELIDAILPSLIPPLPALLGAAPNPQNF